MRLLAQLRLNKVSELIHNSTLHQDVPMARVSVHFMEIIDKVRQGSHVLRLRINATSADMCAAPAERLPAVIPRTAIRLPATSPRGDLRPVPQDVSPNHDRSV